MIIEWWKGAKDDLDAIYEYYVVLNQQAAVRIYNEILDAVDGLLVFPEAYPVEPLIKSKKYHFRSCVVIHGHYKIIYFTDNDKIIITHIWDCRRNPDTIRQSIY
jgi:plasmid stabilization system protein ParE